MVIGIRSGKHPHEVCLLTAAWMLGVIGLVAFDKIATNNVRALPTFYAYILYASLVVGSSIALFGIFRKSLVGALVERAGLIGLSTLLLAYCGIVAIYTGFRGTSFIVFVGAFATANIIRTFQITKEIDQMRAAAVILSPETGGE